MRFRSVSAFVFVIAYAYLNNFSNTYYPHPSTLLVASSGENVQALVSSSSFSALTQYLSLIFLVPSYIRFSLISSLDLLIFPRLFGYRLNGISLMIGLNVK